MKPILLFIVVLFSGSCSPELRLEKLVKKHPELWVPDTIRLSDTLVSPAIQGDTQLLISHLNDTVVVEKDRLVMSLCKLHDTLYLRGKCKSDTVVIKRKIPVEKIRIIRPDTQSALIVKIPWLVAGLIAMCALVVFLVSKFKT